MTLTAGKLIRQVMRKTTHTRFFKCRIDNQLIFLAPSAQGAAPRKAP
ncbi:Uncharacterised protein [Vibrio cholerae]|nr:Uncharacterised protein [Vibrio cholerae]